MQKINVNRISRFTATTTLKQLFEREPKRKAFSIQNNGANNVDFLDNRNSAYGSGYLLKPNLSVDDDHFNPQGALFVISTGGDVELCVWEILSEEWKE